MENNSTSKKLCSVCGKEWTFALRVNYAPDGTQSCEHDSPTIGSSKINKRRKENLEQSLMARRQAGEYAASLPKEEMITVNPPTGEKGKSPEVVPRKVVDSIQEKYANL